jgi:gliding motility-associated transport system permease protein
MRTWALIRKELASYFAGPLVYTVVGVFLMATGYQFYTTLSGYVQIGFGMNILENFWQDFFVNHIGFYLLIVVPLFTMRLLAEERRLGTIELLYTYPLRDREIMFAKFIACLLVFLVFLAGTLLFPAIVYAIQPFDPRPFLARYLGAVLFLAGCIACGLFVSSLTDSQVVASSCTFVILLLFWIITWNEAAVSSSFLTALSQLSTFDHFWAFSRGVIDLKDVTYFVLFVGFFLFLTLRSMESRQWRGRR